LTWEGSRLRVVSADARDGPPDGDTVVVRKGAFGSGEHETTASCLEVLEGLPGVAGARVLDLGSGTGVLAIAALALGATLAVCVDPDLDAVRTAVANCELNGVTARVRHVCGTFGAVAARPFDLVLANVYADVLLAEAPDLVAALAPGGRLLLSGVAWQDHVQVRDRYRGLGLSVLSTRMLEEYVTVLMAAP
jgi:ribosomal protein L11 methyltransferase